MTYSRFTAPFVRFYRRLMHSCVVCGRRTTRCKRDPAWWYCSISCSCYDGTMSVRWEPERKLPKPSLWRGRTEKRQPKEEKYL